MKILKTNVIASATKQSLNSTNCFTRSSFAMTFTSTFIILSLFAFQSFAQTKLYPIEIKGKWGYMDVNGKMQIPAQFDYADEFNEGFAVVALKRLPCVIDEKANRVIDTGLYQNIGRVSEGLAAATDYQWKRFYLNTKGEVAITLSAEVYEARPFFNGVAVVSKATDFHEQKFGHDIATFGYLFGFIDKSGKMLTEFVYDDADDMRAGVARVRKGTKLGLVNPQGQEIVKPAYSDIGVFNEGKAVVGQNGIYGFINDKGEEIIKPQFQFAYAFNNGMAGVWLKDKYGYIDETGTLKVAAQFDAVKPFSEGKAAVLKEGKWGFIDKNGTWVIRNVFDEAGIFSEGLCAVLYKRKWGYIDATGATKIPMELDAAGAFKNGIADILYHNLNLYIDRSGQFLPILK